MSEEPQYESYATVTGLLDGEKVTGVKYYSAYPGFNIITTDSGRRLLASPSSNSIDITSLPEENYISDQYHEVDNDYVVVFSSGERYRVNLESDMIEPIGRIPILSDGESVKELPGPSGGSVSGDYLLTTDGKIIVRRGGGYEEIVGIPFVENIRNDAVYLEDGTIYGYMSWSELWALPDVIGEKVAETSYKYGDMTMVVTESGKIYSLSPSGGSLEAHYVANVRSDEAISTMHIAYRRDSGYSVDIVTNAGRLVGVDFQYSYDGSGEVEIVSINETDLTEEVAQGLPLMSIPQVAKIFFGEAEAADFEIIDNNTLRARVPANARGMYNIYIQPVYSSVPILTSLNYEYIEGDDSGSNTIISAPNTGYKRN